MILAEVREQYRSCSRRTWCKELSAETWVKVSEHHPLFARLEHPYRPGSRATEEEYSLFATSENLNLLERRLKAQMMWVWWRAHCHPCDLTISLMILRVFQLPTALTNICAYKSLVFSDLKRVKDYIPTTSSGEPELLEHRKAEKRQNYGEK